MRFQREGREEPELNITPLIDVVFLLLIFFMVSTTFQKERAVTIELPQASSDERMKQQDPLELVISAEGNYYIGGRKVTKSNRQQLTQAIALALKESDEKRVTIRADQQTPHQAVITAMDAIRHAGIAHIGFATIQGY
ncbi:MAG: biopolymer transporter ExbD [Gammaproteobacteria bacterium]|nr:biopolymer transporter ExbD [Gammaproteobacteria bacterium]